MSDPIRIAVLGSTGLIGTRILEEVRYRPDVRVIAIARREFELPQDARMECFIADPESWGEVLAQLQPDCLINALGTTWKRAGRDEEAFRAVDQHLVVNTAKAAREAGIERMVSISSVGATVGTKNFYLRVKGEVERDLTQLKFKRLDILRPGLLKGRRVDDLRFGEGLAKIASPLIDPFMSGGLRKYRSIPAKTVAHAALGLATRKAAGRFTHDHDAIQRAARDWMKRAETV
ncbi:NAD-dependent epimerase/dehydratase family protein [Altererythrobacter lutimaris]|uniref:NAD-dependent epimerase/dehydratase family protein n=1 Tax=Altererythrobacter lutimaris TaxID=2743979 RepID=A0A850HAR2_9SPHN|nr:NAD-dependent epimerase/dehydratase family protein [Altererythrobacter lutimaris]NVE94600.1 NAD-dependent epimerase/dehydratase family protein [Altererythrobacter lutimaris]